MNTIRRPRISPDRLAELLEQCEFDLAEARRQGHRQWVYTLTVRRAALRDLESRLPDLPEEE